MQQLLGLECRPRCPAIQGRQQVLNKVMHWRSMHGTCALRGPVRGFSRPNSVSRLHVSGKHISKYYIQCFTDGVRKWRTGAC